MKILIKKILLTFTTIVLSCFLFVQPALALGSPTSAIEVSAPSSTNTVTYKYTKTFKYKTVKKNKVSSSIKVSGKSYKKATYKKVQGSNRITVSSKGTVIVKKGTKKGTYVIKVKASVKKTKTTKAKSISYNVKIVIK